MYEVIRAIIISLGVSLAGLYMMGCIGSIIGIPNDRVNTIYNNIQTGTLLLILLVLLMGRYNG